MTILSPSTAMRSSDVPCRMRDALGCGRACVGLDNRLRRSVAVDGAVRRCQEVRRLERRDHRLDVVGRDQLGGHSEVLLEWRARLLEALDVDLVREQEEVAVALVVDAADPVERLELGHRAQRDLHVELIRELRADAARRLARRAAGERLPLEQDDVLHPLLGQVVGDARAHGTATDDHDLGSLGRHERPFRSSRRVIAGWKQAGIAWRGTEPQTTSLGG